MSKIFVSICSYRDPLVSQTLQNMMENESGYHQVTYGVFEQTRLEDSMEINNPELVSHPNVKYKRIDPKYVDGIGWARMINSLQVTDEDFFYMIDSHAIFDKDWDYYIIDEYNLGVKKARKERVVIGSICKTCDLDENGKMFKVTEGSITGKSLYCGFSPNGLPYPVGESIQATDDLQPAIHLHGGNFFTHAAFLKNVGLNGRLYNFGEELYLTLSSIVNGYAIYHPREIHCYHYDESAANPYWTKEWYEPVISDEKRSEIVRKGLDEVWGYIKGLDSKVLEEYRRYTGVDLIHRKLEKRAMTRGTVFNPDENPDTWTIENRTD
jgi:Glycosyltransferase (GlcNAc)